MFSRSVFNVHAHCSDVFCLEIKKKNQLKFTVTLAFVHLTNANLIYCVIMCVMFSYIHFICFYFFSIHKKFIFLFSSELKMYVHLKFDEVNGWLHSYTATIHNLSASDAKCLATSSFSNVQCDVIMLFQTV